MLKDSYSHYILGISADSCESSICLIKNQRVIASFQERLFSRKKSDKNFPEISLKNILLQEKISLNDVEFIVYFDKPFKKINTILRSILFNNIKGFSDFISYDFWQIKQQFFRRRNLQKKLFKIQQELFLNKRQKISQKKFYSEISRKILFTQENFASCGGCFYSSTFRESAILVFNDSPFQSPILSAYGKKNKIDFLNEIKFPHSLLLFKKAVINFFDQKISKNLLSNNIQENIVLEIYDLLKRLIEIKRDGSFHINLIYFRVSRGNLIAKKEFTKLFQSIIENIYDKKSFFIQLNIALEKLILEIVELLLKNIKKATDSKNLLVNESEIITLNLVDKIRQMQIFEKVAIVQFGNGNLEALGSALLTYHQYLRQGRQIADKKLSLIASPTDFSSTNIKDILSVLQVKYLEFSEESQIINLVSQSLNQGLIIGWQRGYVELSNVTLNSPLTIFGGKYSENNFLKFKNFYEKNYLKNQLIGIIFLRDNSLDYFVGNSAKIFNDFKALKLNKDYFNFVRKSKFANKKINEKNDNFTQNSFQKKSLPNLHFLQSINANEDRILYQMISNFYALDAVEFIFSLPLSLKNDILAFDVIDANRCFKKSEIDILLIKNFAMFKEDQNID
jgi:carbamoyltransferase